MSGLLDDAEIQRRFNTWQVFKYSPCSKEEGYNDQVGFHQSNKKFRVILGANRSGKTQAMMAEVAATALGFPYPWWFGEPLPDKLTIWIIVQQFPKNAAEDARIKKLYVGENYLSRSGKWVEAKPLIPAEMIKWHNADYTEVLLHNGNTISIKSNEQKQTAFASNQVDLICVDEPTEPNKWRELCSRMAAVPHSRLIHGLTDVTDTTEYLDQMLESEDPMVLDNFAQFHFTTAGMPHTDKVSAAKAFAFQTEEQRQFTEHGLRPSDLLRCYPHVFRWIDKLTGLEIKNPQGGTGNWIRPFPIPKDWTRYVIHDPGVNVAAAVWFAVEPDNHNIYAYKCVHIKNPGGDYQWVVDSINRANCGDDIYAWYMDPKAAKHRARTYIYAANDNTIRVYNQYSSRYGIKWQEGPDNLESAYRTTRIKVLTGYLNPLNNSMPMMYFFDIKDGLDPPKGLEGMPALKYEFRRYKWDEKREKPMREYTDGIYCCEAAACIPLRNRGGGTAGGWRRYPTAPRDPVIDFMNGKSGMPEGWREEP